MTTLCKLHRAGARYLVILTPRLGALLAALQADRVPAQQREIYRRIDSDVLESTTDRK